MSWAGQARVFFLCIAIERIEMWSSTPVMTFGRRKSGEPSQADPLRQAMTLMTPFAQTHQGVFLLDGPAIGTGSAHSTGNALNVYCLFPSENMVEASRVALGALRPLTSDIRIYQGEGQSSFLAEIRERTRVVGDRRRVKRRNIASQKTGVRVRTFCRARVI